MTAPDFRVGVCSTGERGALYAGPGIEVRLERLLGGEGYTTGKGMIRHVMTENTCAVSRSNPSPCNETWSEPYVVQLIDQEQIQTKRLNFHQDMC